MTTTMNRLPIELYRGEDRVLTFTVALAGASVNLAVGTWAATEIEFEIKKKLEDSSTIVVSKKLTTVGVVRLPQFGSTLGQLTVTLTAADTNLPSGQYFYDLAITYAAVGRTFLVNASECLIREAVNLP